MAGEEGGAAPRTNKEDALPPPVRVVLADDDPGFLESLRACLQPPIVIVGTAGDGEDAVDQIERHRPDVAVLDVLMPRLGGVEAANRCREKLPECRIVLISGSIFAESSPDLALADRFLPKSEAMRQLAATILELSRR